jgi:hypothetical protein
MQAGLRGRSWSTGRSFVYKLATESSKPTNSLCLGYFRQIEQLFDFWRDDFSRVRMITNSTSEASGEWVMIAGFTNISVGSSTTYDH